MNVSPQSFRNDESSDVRKRAVVDRRKPSVTKIDTRTTYASPARRSMRCVIPLVVLGTIAGTIIILSNLGIHQTVKNQEATPRPQLVKEQNAVAEFKLREGMMVTTGKHETKENTVFIVDRVVRTKDNRLAVHRSLMPSYSKEIVISTYRLRIPKQLPQGFNSTFWEFEQTHICEEYQRVLMAIVMGSGALKNSNESVNTLNIGLGGGTLDGFLRHHTKNVNVTSVEIDPAMLEVAKKYFGFVEDERRRCIVDDGAHFLEEAHRRGEKYDVILMDACKNVPGIVEAPVKQMIEPNVIKYVASATTSNGIVLINHVSYGEGTASLETVMARFQGDFAGCVAFDVASHLNKIIACVKRHSLLKRMQTTEFRQEALKHLLQLSQNA